MNDYQPLSNHSCFDHGKMYSAFSNSPRTKISVIFLVVLLVESFVPVLTFQLSKLRHGALPCRIYHVPRHIPLRSTYQGHGISIRLSPARHWRRSESVYLPQRRSSLLRSSNDADSGGNKGASVPNLTTSLVKSIVGSGVLALPAGVAALGDQPFPTVLPLAFVMIGITGALNAFFFELVGRVCDETGATSYKDAWDKTIGEESSQWVALTVTLKTLLSCLAFSMIIADSISSLTGLGRLEALLAVTALCLLPLTLKRDLSSLAPFSFVGILGVGITIVSLVVRCLDGSYAVDGQFVNDIANNLRPSFGVTGGPRWEGIILPCTLATAFVAHYNAPRFYQELREDIKDRFPVVTYASFSISAILFCITTAAGFLTFGGHSNGFILNNYASSDPLIATSRFALALSIIFTYPLPFVGLRDGIFDVLGPTLDPSDNRAFVVVTLALLTVVTIGAAVIQDLGLVLSVGGGTFSTAVAAVFPTLMFRASHRGHEDVVSSSVALGGMVASVIIGLIGVYLALQKAGVI